MFFTLKESDIIPYFEENMPRGLFMFTRETAVELWHKYNES